jgi:hypothetical protein
VVDEELLVVLFLLDEVSLTFFLLIGGLWGLVALLLRPFLDGGGGEQGGVFAALEGLCVVVEVAFDHVQLEGAESISGGLKGHPLTNLLIRVLGELGDDLAEHPPFALVEVGDAQEGGEPAGPDCAFLEVEFVDEGFQDVGGDVLGFKLGVDDAEDLEVQFFELGKRQELGEFLQALLLGLAA